MPKPVRVKTQADINQERGCAGCAIFLLVCFIGLVGLVVVSFGIFAASGSAG